MGADLQEVCEALEAIGEELDLTLTLARHHDKAMHFLVKIEGKREHVHEAPLYLLNHCPFVRIDFLSAEYYNHLYRMTFMISATDHGPAGHVPDEHGEPEETEPEGSFTEPD